MSHPGEAIPDADRDACVDFLVVVLLVVDSICVGESNLSSVSS